MWIKELTLRSFRNYPFLSLSLNKGINIFVGDNAQGKTNLLESIYVMALSKSYRANKDSELIIHESPDAQIQCRIVREAEMTLSVAFNRATPKRLTVNNKPTKPNSFVGFLNVILFIPDNLQLIKGSPGERRRFLDTEICQIDPVYRDTLSKYQRVLVQRNQLLKEAHGRRSYLPLLEVWDEQLIKLGSRIIKKRETTIDKLSLLGNMMHRRITEDVEDLYVAYIPFFETDSLSPGISLQDIEQRFRDELEKNLALELQRGFTAVGPQRDDIRFLIDGVDAKAFGSQGQQRTAILACKLAEMELMHAETGTYPVVLLDDVMSELDYHRRQFLLNILDSNAQTIITTTNLGSFSSEILRSGSVFRIEDGKVRDEDVDYNKGE